VKTVAIIQARMGSTRLPGKVLMDLAGETVLARGLRRALRIPGVDQVVVATTERAQDDAIIAEAERTGCGVFRGSEEDVLSRYLGAAERFGADLVVRITSDCPLLDPQVSGKVVALLKKTIRAGERADYCSNTLARTYPRGLDTEAFTRSALERTAAQAGPGREREHVTLRIYEHPQDFRLLSVKHEVDHSRHRWTVDTEDDLRVVREIYARLGGLREFGMEEVLALLAREPWIAEINAHIEQKKA
jgi:spore coat polysaccharide biosynthesis protein SpsF